MSQPVSAKAESAARMNSLVRFDVFTDVTFVGNVIDPRQVQNKCQRRTALTRRGR